MQRVLPPDFVDDGTQPLERAITISQGPDGTEGAATATYLCSAPGEYCIHVALRGAPLGGSPFPCTVAPAGIFPTATREAYAAAARRYAIASLTLDDEAIWARERARTKDAPSILGQSVDAPLVLLAPYLALCALLDGLFEGRPIARFWFLESVARMPYFSYISMLHLYESLGWWRRSAVAKKTHFAEEWNEFHHLLCMEALGGDAEWRDRFAAQHASTTSGAPSAAGPSAAARTSTPCGKKRAFSRRSSATRTERRRACCRS